MKDSEIIQEQIESYKKELNGFPHRCIFCREDGINDCKNCVLKRRFNKACGDYKTFNNYCNDESYWRIPTIPPRIKSLQRLKRIIDKEDSK